MAWDPRQYALYAGPRLRPAGDLIERVPLEAPRVVYDLGCGEGHATALIARRWPEARITGIDGSPEMLARARERDLAVAWEQGDIATWTPDRPPDLVYSNAALHWLDGHAALFPRLMRALAPGGALAVQMPHNFGAPSHTCIAETIDSGPWRARLAPLLRRAPVADAAVYHRILAPLSGSLDIWETEYLHVLDGDDPVVAWTKGSVLGPLMAALDEDQREAFLADYAGRVRRAYPPETDGRTLMPFRRLFMVALR